jgi:hypothetical protein
MWAIFTGSASGHESLIRDHWTNEALTELYISHTHNIDKVLRVCFNRIKQQGDFMAGDIFAIRSVPKDQVVYVYRTIPSLSKALLKRFNPKIHRLSKESDDFWYLGKEQILQFCKRRFGFESWKTAKQWQREYAFPIRHMPNGEPFIIYLEAINWALTYDNLMREAKQNEKMKIWAG